MIRVLSPRVASMTLACLACQILAIAAEPNRPAHDARLTAKPVDLNGYFPFTVPADRAAWEQRRQELLTQLQLATGLWPMPARGPVAATIHGAIPREGYTVEKVFFSTLPGHFVTGNLYRPTGRSGPFPAVLCPHGHWANGRMHEASDAEVKKEIQSGAEQYPTSARYLLQAKCVQLARMGCLVFHFDMVGYADSMAIPHRQAFLDAQSLLWLQSQMGLQTWNALRSLDFVLGLPDVDKARVGVTGASGGGTQTFILAALDDRVRAAFPAVMVGTAMQGGCVCENAPYLRLGTGNVELAALIAPRPLGMTGARDWTIDIETKGLPELKRLYGMYGAEANVQARCFPQFGHNYNQVSREVMYQWFNKHLALGQAEPIREQPFEPIPPRELTVYNAAHPRPGDERDTASVRAAWTRQLQDQFQSYRPHDAASWNRFHDLVRPALEQMIHDRLPAADEVNWNTVGDPVAGAGFTRQDLIVRRRGTQEAIPAVWLRNPESDGTVVVWAHPRGRAGLLDPTKPSPMAKALLERKASIVTADLFGTGSLALDQSRVNAQYAGFTFGYNRSLLAERVHDLLTTIRVAHALPNTRRVMLLGTEEAGPWVVIARALAGDAVSRTAADRNSFDFENITRPDDPMMLPGALKYGGLDAFAGLCAPGAVLLHNAGERPRESSTRVDPRECYRASGAARQFESDRGKRADADVADWLLQPVP